MKKEDIINEISEIFNVSKQEGKETLDVILGLIIEGLLNDGEVIISPLGKFVIDRRKKRKAWDFITKQTIVIPEKNIVKYKPSLSIKKKLED